MSQSTYCATFTYGLKQGGEGGVLFYLSALDTIWERQYIPNFLKQILDKPPEHQYNCTQHNAIYGVYPHIPIDNLTTNPYTEYPVLHAALDTQGKGRVCGVITTFL